MSFGLWCVDGCLMGCSFCLGLCVGVIGCVGLWMMVFRFMCFFVVFWWCVVVLGLYGGFVCVCCYWLVLFFW